MDGLPLFGGSQLAVNATFVSALHANGQAPRGAAQEDGAALITARRRKERRYPGWGQVPARGWSSLAWKWRKMVSGDTDLPQAAGTREGPFRRV